MRTTGEKPPLQEVDNVAFEPTADDVVRAEFKPGPPQPMGNIKVFVFLVVLLCMAEGYAVNGIASAALIQLEKQFGLPSTKSALISSAQDIGALVVVLFVSFVGSRYCTPHWVALGSVVMALGSFLFIVPHLATSASQEATGPPPSGLCELSADNTTNTPPAPDSASSSSNSLSHYLGVFMIANIVHGVGFTPMFTLGTAYLDQNEEHTLAAVYVGMTYAAAALGVALGFFVGGQITETYYVDFDTVDQSKLTFGPRDPQWIGAWWLGFIPACGVFLLLAPFIYGFPKSLPSGEKKSDSTSSRTAECGPGAPSLLGAIKDTFLSFFKALKKLVTNPPFILLCLGAAAETLIISGVTSFAFKYLAEQYSMAFDEVGNLLGGLIIVGATGMLSGGIIIRLLKLEARGMTRLLALLSLLAAVLGCAILADCTEVRLAGREVPYPGDTSVGDYSSNCQGRCQCSGISFNPVCGKDSLVYFSPCHAGCLEESNPGPMATYHNCSCVALAQNMSAADDSASASRGRCVESCDNRNIFLPCLFLMFFAVLLTTTPNSMACLRVVDQDIRPFALGCQWMLIRLLGTIPGPPVVGFVMDQACLVWSSAPDGSQFCTLYSKDHMSTGIFIWWVVVNLLAAVFYLAASCSVSHNTKSVDLNKQNC